MNKYKQMMDEQQAKYEEFMKGKTFSAYGEEDKIKGMKSLGIDPNHPELVVHLGFGEYIIAEYLDEYNQMFEDFSKELNENIAADKTGEGFLHDMFLHEFEYPETFGGSIEEILSCYGFTKEQYHKDRRLQTAMDTAYFDWIREKNQK